jgi:hypothetical protein
VDCLADRLIGEGTGEEGIFTGRETRRWIARFGVTEQGELERMQYLLLARIVCSTTGDDWPSAGPIGLGA